MKRSPFDQLRPHVGTAVAGVVALIASKDRVLDIAAFGKADLASNRAMTADTLFWIASTTKAIVGTVLMMLAETGQIALDDTIEKYLPAFAGQMQVIEIDGDRQVLQPAAKLPTIRQAMNHTSGLPFFSRPENKIDRYSLSEAAIGYAMTPLLFEPGTKYQYGNVGINSVGRILELVTGQSFHSLLEDRLFRPLGMSDTTFVPNEEQVSRLATNYTLDETKTQLRPIPIHFLSYPLTSLDRMPCPGGGLFSTVADLARFARMILNGGELEGRRYLSESSVRAMTSTQTASLFEHSGPGSGYGIGWETFAPSSSTVPNSALPGRCGHGGACSNHMDINPIANRVSIYMVQQQGWITPEAEEMRKAFNRACADEAMVSRE